MQLKRHFYSSVLDWTGSFTRCLVNIRGLMQSQRHFAELLHRWCGFFYIVFSRSQSLTYPGRCSRSQNIRIKQTVKNDNRSMWVGLLVWEHMGEHKVANNMTRYLTSPPACESVRALILNIHRSIGICPHTHRENKSHSGNGARLINRCPGKHEIRLYLINLSS